MDVRGTILSIAQQLAENLNAERCTIRVPEENKMKLVAVYGINVDMREEEVEIAGTIVGEAFTSGQILNIPDITKDRRYDQSYIVHDSQKALLAIPLQFDKDILGVAQVYAKEPFSAKQISLARTLSQFVALVLSHEQFRRTSHEAILRVVEAIIEGSTFEEISMRTAEQIIKNFEVERCTVYRIFEKEGQLWCEITAGIPVADHGIGLKEELIRHPDIEAAAKSQKISIINDPLNDPLTLHFAMIVRQKQINSILYVPVSQEIVLAVDATKGKKNFGPEEIELCVEAGRILAMVFKRIQADLQVWRDLTINPTTSIGGWSKRVIELVKILGDEATKLEEIIPKRL